MKRIMDNCIVTGDNCRISYRFDGSENAPVLLLSNSLGTSMAMWEPQIAMFSADFRVLRYDGRGHGGSDAPAGAYSLDRLGRDVVELLDALDLDAVDFCGLSLGGMVGQWLGIREPTRVKRLVLANTSAYMGPPANWDSRIATVLQEGMGAIARASIARWFTSEFAMSSPDAVERILQGLLATDPVGYAGNCAAIRDMDMRPTAQLNHGPTLVIGGSRDPATPPADAEALKHILGNASITFLNAAHLSNVEQPDEFASNVSRFLKFVR